MGRVGENLIGKPLPALKILIQTLATLKGLYFDNQKYMMSPNYETPIPCLS